MKPGGLEPLGLACFCFCFARVTFLFISSGERKVFFWAVERVGLGSDLCHVRTCRLNMIGHIKSYLISFTINFSKYMCYLNKE